MSDSYDEESIDHFIKITNSSRSIAEQYLSRNQNDLVESIEDYYANNSKDTTNSILNSQQQQQQQQKKKSKTSGGIKTFRDLNNNEDDDDDDKTQTNFFTGGEKSGLQVEDPNKKDKKLGGGDGGEDQSIIDRIFQRAKDQTDQPDDRPSNLNQFNNSSTKFSGTGFKLGDNEQPSEEIIDPNSNISKPPSKVSREITFWKQGFTVGDGPLHRYDDPNNERVLNELNRGRVPVSLLDVEFGQDVDVSVFRKTDENWVPPKRKVGGFSGSGQRLGSPVPGESIPVESTPQESKPQELNKPKPEDQGEGDSLVQIRFASGKKISHKFNSTDSLIEVYSFVRNHEFNSDKSKDFMLSHSFPVRPIDESNDLTVADAKLKNAVIVQRWK